MSPENSKSEAFPYFNRELSWLAFNQRVLEQAKSTEYPLLERMKFLAFFSSNLDEFFEIRVAGLMQQVKSNSIERQNFSQLLRFHTTLDLAPQGPSHQYHYKTVNNAHDQRLYVSDVENGTTTVAL